jgi:hypothetical protein
MWKSVTMNGGTYGFQLVGTSGDTEIRSEYLLGSAFDDVSTVFQISPSTNSNSTRTMGITLDNVAFSGVTDGIVDTNGKVYLDGSVGSIATWALGPLLFSAALQGKSLG